MVVYLKTNLKALGSTRIKKLEDFVACQPPLLYLNHLVSVIYEESIWYTTSRRHVTNKGRQKMVGGIAVILTFIEGKK